MAGDATDRQLRKMRATAKLLKRLDRFEAAMRGDVSALIELGREHLGQRGTMTWREWEATQLPPEWGGEENEEQ